MEAKAEPYPSDVTPKEWLIVKPLLPKSGKLGRPPRYSQRVMLNAMMYVVRSGCTWRMMPKEFPHWRLVYYYFAKWQSLGVWQQLNDALRHSRERLALATESARIGIWDWDVVANRLVWDARMYELYGIREQDFSGAYDAWQQGLHPDDRVSGDAAIVAAIEGVKDFNIEFRAVWPNGEVHDIEAHALVQSAGNGRATRMIGVNWDITERKRATETIRLQADQHATMLATTSDGFWLLAIGRASCRERV